MGRLKLDLHPIARNGAAIEAALHDAMAQAVAKRLESVEIVPGKGSGQLKKHVLRFLGRPDIKRLYHRLEKDDKNFGRVFVHFRH
jgi:DNA-nicking Smr family endonuclease